MRCRLKKGYHGVAWCCARCGLFVYGNGSGRASSTSLGTNTSEIDDVMAEAFSPFPLWGRSYLNWSDFPFTISATETTGYNDNVLGLAQGQPQSPGAPSRGDFFSNTVFGASTKMYLGQQQFFADGTYGLTRYLTDTADNTHQYSLDAGLNWQIASRCLGRFIAAQYEYLSPINQQVGPGVNNVLSNLVSETATCLLTSDIGVLLDSGWSSVKTQAV